MADWTKAQDDLLLWNFGRGLDLPKLAAFLHRSPEDVVSRLMAHHRIILDVTTGDYVRIETWAKRADLKAVPVAMEPPPGLLMSMAMRRDLALGCPGYYDDPVMRAPTPGVSHARRLEVALGEARQAWEEVVGLGFYRPEKADHYLAIQSANSEEAFQSS